MNDRNRELGVALGFLFGAATSCLAMIFLGWSAESAGLICAGCTAAGYFASFAADNRDP